MSKPLVPRSGLELAPWASYRKIGGIHWFSFGRLRIALCLSQRQPAKPALTPKHRSQRAKRALTEDRNQRDANIIWF